MALGLRYIVLLLPMAVSEIWGLTKRERGRTGRRPLSSALRPQYDQKYLNQKIKTPTKGCHSIKGHTMRVRNQYSLKSYQLPTQSFISTYRFLILLGTVSFSYCICKISVFEIIRYFHELVDFGPLGCDL